MFLSRAQLLHALDWPDLINIRPGRLTWTHTTGQGLSTRVISASVLVSDRSIACRMRSALVSRPGRLEPHVEAVWKTTPAGPPQLSRWILEGQARNPREPSAPEEAVSKFRSAVAAMGASPVFVPSFSAEMDPNGVTI